MDITTYKMAQKYANNVAAGFSHVEVKDSDIIFTLNDGKTAKVSVPTPTGLKGDKGEPGIQGPKGDKGEQGNSFTYDMFTPEQLEALKGPKGDKGDSAELSEADRDAIDNVKMAKNIIFTNGLTKTIEDNNITVSINNGYIKTIVEDNQITKNDFLNLIKTDLSFKQLIEKYVVDYLNEHGADLPPIKDPSEGEDGGEEEPNLPTVFDVLAMTDSYENANSDYSWYNFTDAKTYGMIDLNEPSTQANGDPNFGDKYIPSFIMNLSQPLNLMETPILDIKLITLGTSPINFKFVDGNGNSSQPIVVGALKVNGLESFVIDTTSYPDLADGAGRITSLGTGQYSSVSATAAAINTAKGKVKPDMDNGDLSKFYSGHWNILSDLQNGFSTDGFDATNITKIEMQTVEHFDKGSITFKTRIKSIVLGQFNFTDRIEEDGE